MDYPPELAGLEPDIEIVKRQWGAFHATELDLQLRRRGVETTSSPASPPMGVEQTLREGYQHGYACIVAEDACTSLAADMHAFAVGRIFPRIARVRSTAEIVAAIGEAGAQW